MTQTQRLSSTLLLFNLIVACSGEPTQGGVRVGVGGGTSGDAGAAGAAAGGSSGVSTAGSGGSGVCDGTPTLGTVSPAALKLELAQAVPEFLLINVHVPLAGQVPGTDANIAYSDVPAIESFIGTDKSKPVVIYCYSDHMALIAGPQLISDGYCHVRYMQGGLSAWKSAGYAVDPT